MKQNSYFIVTIALNTILPSGVSKPATEQYLINALSFTEAETPILEYFDYKPLANDSDESNPQ
jgi:hypothetical protein